ncbi:hypothetical protein GOODEAATRI_015266, partial [Goodea atripinnis]
QVSRLITCDKVKPGANPHTAEENNSSVSTGSKCETQQKNYLVQFLLRNITTVRHANPVHHALVTICYHKPIFHHIHCKHQWAQDTVLPLNQHYSSLFHFYDQYGTVPLL